MDNSQVVPLTSVICSAAVAIASYIIALIKEWKLNSENAKLQIRIKEMESNHEIKKIAWESHKNAFEKLMTSYKNLLVHSGETIAEADRMDMVVSTLDLLSYTAKGSTQFQNLQQVLMLLANQNNYQEAVKNQTVFMKLANLMCFIADSSLEVLLEQQPK